VSAPGVALVLAAAALALWSWGRVAAPRDYFVASRSAGPLLVGLGGTAAGLSAFVFVGGPGLFATVGAASLWIVLSAPLTGALQCWAVGERVVGLAREHDCLTVPDLFAARFGDGLPRALAAVSVCVGSVATLAVQVKGTAVIGEVLLGLPGWEVALLAMGATVLYTAAGGMRAGLPAEAAQGLIMACAALWLAYSALSRAGGAGEAVATIMSHRPELLTAWGPVGAPGALGWFLLFALGTCAQPHYLQKFLLIRDLRSLRWLPAVMTVSLLSVLTVWVGLGLGGTALWLRGELLPGSPDELAPAFLASATPWVAAVASVAVMAAVMSTAASLLNMAAAALTRDLPRALGRSVGVSLGPARAATVLIGMAALALGLGSTRTVALLGVLGWGTFTAALLPAVLVGLPWAGASRRGVVAAMIAGPATQVGLDLIGPAGFEGWWEPGLTGAAVGTILLVLVSALAPPTLRGEGRCPKRDEMSPGAQR